MQLQVILQGHGNTFLTVLTVQSLSISRMKDCEEMLACVVLF